MISKLVGSLKLFFFMVDNSMLFDGFVFVLWLIWGGVVGFLVVVVVVLEDSE